MKLHTHIFTGAMLDSCATSPLFALLAYMRKKHCLFVISIQNAAGFAQISSSGSKNHA